jgi:hypothetical protein
VIKVILLHSYFIARAGSLDAYGIAVAYREDQARIKDENSTLNTHWLRKTALAL